MTEPGVDSIRWSLDEPEPAPSPARVLCPQPRDLTDSRADLVRWWRWRYSSLQADLTETEDLLIRSLSEAHGHRAVLRAALDALLEQGCQHDRLREQHRRLRDEDRSHRERDMVVTT